MVPNMQHAEKYFANHLLWWNTRNTLFLQTVNMK